MKKVLWLCSWYPHPGDPYEGDFIQRHAKAVSAFIPVTVFYTSQAGHDDGANKNESIIQRTGAVDEKLIFFRYGKTGISLLDTVIYNIFYYHTYKKAITEYIEKAGPPDIIHVHIPMKAGMLGRWIKRRWGIPYIVSEHSSHYNAGTGDNFFKKNFFHQHNVKKIFQKASAVTNVSAIVGNTLMSLFELPDVKTIHNTVDTRFFYYKRHPVLKFRFFHASTLTEHHKNIGGILYAVSGLIKLRQDFELVIAGPASTELKQKINELGLSHFVTLIGEVSYQEVAAQMQKASAFILFSRYENFPCVVIEALCCGLPVIASDVGGIREAVNDTNGLLVKSEDKDGLIAAMNKMINEIENYDRQQIADKAKSLYGYEVIGKKFYDLYASIAAKNNNRLSL